MVEDNSRKPVSSGADHSVFGPFARLFGRIVMDDSSYKTKPACSHCRQEIKNRNELRLTFGRKNAPYWFYHEKCAGLPVKIGPLEVRFPSGRIMTLEEALQASHKDETVSFWAGGLVFGLFALFAVATTDAWRTGDWLGLIFLLAVGALVGLLIIAFGIWGARQGRRILERIESMY